MKRPACKHTNARVVGQYWAAGWKVALWCACCGALRKHWDRVVQKRFRPAKRATWKKARHPQVDPMLIRLAPNEDS